MIGVYIGNDRLDLFKDEGISITSSVLDIQDITKNTTDYSKSFTVPASSRNNRIFKHYWEFIIDNGFDARVSVEGRIEIDDMLFRKGQFLLQKVNLKHGTPESYTINFWGNLVSLKDVFGTDKLSDLDLSAFDHEYTSDIVKSMLVNSDPTNDMHYNLLVKKRYYYSSDPADCTDEETTSNIHYKPTGSCGVQWDDVRPSLRIEAILEAIETKYGITFSREFFGRKEFTDLFLWLNNKRNGSVASATKIVDWDSGDSDNINFTTDIGTFNTSDPIGSFDGESWDLIITVTPDSGYEGIEYEIRFYESVGQDITASIETTGEGNLVTHLRSQTTGLQEYEFQSYWEVKSNSKFEYTAMVYQLRRYNGATFNYTTFSTSNTLDVKFVVSENIPDMTILDFLKGIFQMFKLVVIPQDDGTIYVNDLTSYYSSGDLINLTPYVDVENIDISRGDILNDISYKFSDPKTILNLQYKDNYSRAYGDSYVKLYDDNGKLLEGSKLNLQLPFEQIVYERLKDTYTDTLTNVQYGAVIDTELNSTNTNPHIFYNIQQSVGGLGIGFVDGSGTKTKIIGIINTPFHSNYETSPSNCLIFGSEVNEWNGEVMYNTLYANFHQEYINEIFNIKRRNYVAKTKILPTSVLLKLSLNDVIEFGENYYRIDKFTTDLTTGATEFNGVSVSQIKLGLFSSNDTYIILTKEAQSHSSHITNLTTYTYNKIDNGSGTTWITVSDDGSGNIVFTVTENTDEFRDVYVQIIDDVSGDYIYFYIGQQSGLITADNSIITVDTTTITADNE